MPNVLRFTGVLAVFVVALAGAVWTTDARERETAERELARRESAHAMLEAVLVRESAVRGYIQTSRESTLEPYNEAAASLTESIRVGLSLSGEDDGQAIQTQDRLAKQWAALAEEAIVRVRKGQPVTVESTFVRSDLLERFQRANDDLVDDIAAEVDAAHRASLLRSVLLIALLSGAFAVSAGIVLARLRRRERRRQLGEERYHASQREFAETLQVTENESEAHALVKRHLERSLPGAEIVVLNRNNSQNRLEATTPVASGSELALKLVDSSPRSCLAVRLGRAHVQGGDHEPLLACGLCAGPARSTCVPSLVGGEVIGSVLVSHEWPLEPSERSRVDESVSQAAPVLANLRNLAVAEIRAATDALTGLPNARSLRDNLKRMVAQAERSSLPLSAVLCDLDHFKQINDVYGHDKGDQALAAASAALRGALRESDLAGRYGGEEFLILLPNTSLEGAIVLAEKLRTEVGLVNVPGVDRAITASFGVASLPEDAPDGEMLVRMADRALYAAKGRGRNCVVASAELVAETV